MAATAQAPVPAPVPAAVEVRDPERTIPRATLIGTPLLEGLVLRPAGGWQRRGEVAS